MYYTHLLPDWGCKSPPRMFCGHGGARVHQGCFVASFWRGHWARRRNEKPRIGHQSLTNYKKKSAEMFFQIVPENLSWIKLGLGLQLKIVFYQSEGVRDGKQIRKRCGMFYDIPPTLDQCQGVKSITLLVIQTSNTNTLFTLNLKITLLARSQYQGETAEWYHIDRSGGQPSLYYQFYQQNGIDQ